MTIQFKVGDWVDTTGLSDKDILKIFAAFEKQGFPRYEGCGGGIFRGTHRYWINEVCDLVARGGSLEPESQLQATDILNMESNTMKTSKVQDRNNWYMDFRKLSKKKLKKVCKVLVEEFEAGRYYGTLEGLVNHDNPTVFAFNYLGVYEGGYTVDNNLNIDTFTTDTQKITWKQFKKEFLEPKEETSPEPPYMAWEDFEVGQVVRVISYSEGYFAGDMLGIDLEISHRDGDGDYIVTTESADFDQCIHKRLKAKVVLIKDSEGFTPWYPTETSECPDEAVGKEVIVKFNSSNTSRNMRKGEVWDWSYSDNGCIKAYKVIEEDAVETITDELDTSKVLSNPFSGVHYYVPTETIQSCCEPSWETMTNYIITPDAGPKQVFLKFVEETAYGFCPGSLDSLAASIKTTKEALQTSSEETSRLIEELEELEKQFKELSGELTGEAVEKVNDWENWSVGDVVRCVSQVDEPNRDDCEVGDEYIIQCIDRDDRSCPLHLEGFGWSRVDQREFIRISKAS